MMLIFSVSYFVITFFSILILQQFKFDGQHSVLDMTGFAGIFPTIISAVFVYFQLPNITKYCRSKFKLIFLLLLLTVLAWQLHYFILLGPQDLVSFYQELYSYLQRHEVLYYSRHYVRSIKGWHARTNSGFYLYSDEVLKYFFNTLLSMIAVLNFKFNKYCKNNHGEMSEIILEKYFHKDNSGEIKMKLEELEASNQMDFDIYGYFPTLFSNSYIVDFKNTCRLLVTKYKCNECSYACDQYELYSMNRKPIKSVFSWLNYNNSFQWNLRSRYDIVSEDIKD